MARRFAANESARERARHSETRARHDRECIAHTAARLIAEHGLAEDRKSVV